MGRDGTYFFSTRVCGGGGGKVMDPRKGTLMFYARYFSRQFPMPHTIVHPALDGHCEVSAG